MTKRHEAKYKIDRRLGQNIWGRPKSPINKREYGPGQHGQRRKGKLSDYGVQLRAKQKLKGYYANMSERHFRGIYEEARRLKGDTGAHMIGLLGAAARHHHLSREIRAHRVCRTAIRQSRPRQGQRATCHDPELPGESRRSHGSQGQVETAGAGSGSKCAGRRDVPDYVETDHSKMTAKLSRMPLIGDVPYPVHDGAAPGRRILFTLVKLSSAISVLPIC